MRDQFVGHTVREILLVFVPERFSNGSTTTDLVWFGWTLAPA